MTAAASADLQAIDLIVIEDSEDDYLLLVRSLRNSIERVSARRIETADELQAALSAGPWSCVISDHRLPRFSSHEALRQVRAYDPDLPFLIVSGTIGEEAAVEAMRAGADDYIMKDKLGRLLPALQHALTNAAARRRQREAEAALVESEARFRALTTNLPGMVVQMQLTDSGLNLVYVSEGSRRLFGVAPERLIAEPALLFDLIALPDANALRHTLRDAAIGRHDVQWVGRTAASSSAATAWIEFVASARRLPSGRVLWDGIVTDISLQKRAEQELIESQTELRELASHLAQIREHEREAIAREIHDDVGSTLTAVKFDMTWLKQELKGEPLFLSKLQQMDQLVDSVILSSTRIMLDLRPAIIDEGIVASLEWQARNFEERMDIPCSFASNAEEIALDRDQSIAVFRIVQEALNNIAKYAGARQVGVRLSLTDNRLRLEVQDDGKGIAETDLGKADCFGLRGMKERALSLGGTLDIATALDRGTTIALSLPLSVASPVATA